MQLPPQLKQAVEQEARRIGLAKLAPVAAELSDGYRFRQGAGASFMASPAHRIAYVATRLPATYAAVHAVLTEVKRLLPELKLTSLLDLGAGPGTVAWAAHQVLAELQKITLLERDRGLIQLGQSFAAQSPHEALRGAAWLLSDLAHTKSLPPHDLVICSYALGELPFEQARETAKTAWQAAATALVILEPGTKKGFTLMRQLRADLIAAGGHVLAPCPHEHACPMTENDWCHFAARVERSALHRKLKAASLGYEDEKYSYLVMAKQPVKSASARILRHPQVNSGFVKLQLCTPNGLQNLTVTRSDKEAFKQARKADWGDDWE